MFYDDMMTMPMMMLMKMIDNTLQQGVALADLPYDYKALEPSIGEQTLRIHHGKHHAKYVATTNELIKGTELEGDDVVTILRKAHNTNQGLFNNAAQSFNHEFYWQSMKPGGGGKPTGKLAELIDRDFGSYDNFRKEFTTAALTGTRRMMIIMMMIDSHGDYD